MNQSPCHSTSSGLSSRAEDKKKPNEALKRLQRVKVAMADPEEAGLPWYRFPVNAPGRMPRMFDVQSANSMRLNIIQQYTAYIRDKIEMCTV